MSTNNKKLIKPLAILLLVIWTLMGCRTLLAAAPVDSMAGMPDQVSEHPAGDMHDQGDHPCCNSGAMEPLAQPSQSNLDQSPSWELSTLWSSMLVPDFQVAPPASPTEHPSALSGSPPLFIQNCTFLI